MGASSGMGVKGPLELAVEVAMGRDSCSRWPDDEVGGWMELDVESTVPFSVESRCGDGGREESALR